MWKKNIGETAFVVESYLDLYELIEKPSTHVN